MRRILAVFLLLSVLCQAFAMAGQSLAPQRGDPFELEHVEMHREGLAHHHDEDGMTYQDDSPESTAHMLSDGGGGSAALIQFSALALPFDRLPPPVVMAELVGPPPYIGGLRRPPRQIS